jgi:hypothetical protein
MTSFSYDLEIFLSLIETLVCLGIQRTMKTGDRLYQTISNACTYLPTLKHVILKE